MRSFLLFLILALPAMAETILPALYDVTGVAANDVLNVREAPNADASIISSIPPDAVDIEVVAQDGNWGLINVGERSGWASMTYLKARHVPDYLTIIGQPLTCFGTEPFWSYTQDPVATSIFTYFDDPAQSYGQDSLFITQNHNPGEWLFSQLGYVRLTGFMRQEACNDGMSDRTFGLSLTLLIEEDVAIPYVLNGCCSLAPAN